MNISKKNSIFFFLLLIFNCNNVQAIWNPFKITSLVLGFVTKYVELAMPYPRLDRIFGPIEEKRKQLRGELFSSIGTLQTNANKNDASIVDLGKEISDTQKKFNEQNDKLTTHANELGNAAIKFEKNIIDDIDSYKVFTLNQLTNNRTEFDKYIVETKAAQKKYENDCASRSNLFQECLNLGKKNTEERFAQMKKNIKAKEEKIAFEKEGIEKALDSFDKTAQSVQDQISIFQNQIVGIAALKKNHESLKEKFELHQSETEKVYDAIEAYFKRKKMRQHKKPNSIRELSKNIQSINNNQGNGLLTIMGQNV